MYHNKIEPLFLEHTRLEICVALMSVSEMEYYALKGQLTIEDSHLAMQIQILDKAGYVGVKNQRPEMGPQYVWLSLSAAGHRASQRHISALKQISKLAQKA